MPDRDEDAGEHDAADEHEHEDAGEEFLHDVTSLRAVFRERRITPETMERPLRLATAGALAGLIGVCLLIALRDIHASGVFVGRTNGVTTEVPLPMFVATVVLLCVGFAYLLTSVTLATLPVAVIGLILITGAMGVETGSFGHLYGAADFLRLLPSWAQWASRALLVAVWGVAVATRLVDRRRAAPATDAAPAEHRASGRRLRLIVLGTYSVLIGGWFTILATTTPSAGGLNLYGEIVDIIMIDIVLLVFPVLQVAAVDFGEWGGLTGERLAAAAGGRGRTNALVALSVLACGSLAVFGYVNSDVKHPILSGGRVMHVLPSLWLLAVGAVVLVVVGRAVGAPRRSWPAKLSFASIFAVTAFIAYLAAPVSAVFSHGYHNKPVEQIADGQFTGSADVLSTRAGTGAQSYTLLIPRGWLHSQVQNVDLWTNYAYPGAHPGAPDTPRARAAAGTFPIVFTSLEQFAAGLKILPGTAHTDDGWFVGQLNDPAEDAHVWVRGDPESLSTSYVLYTYARHVPEAASEELVAIAHSFRPAGAAPATLPKQEEAVDPGAEKRADHTLAYTVAMSLGLLVVLLLGYHISGRRWGARTVSGVFLLGVFAGTTVLLFANAMGRVVAGPRTHWPYVSQYGLLTAVGVGGLALTAVLAARGRGPTGRRLLTATITFAATIWALEGMTVLYNHALRASRVSVWAAIIVIVAIGWDVTMSGESLTNRGTDAFPRATRVLGFLGYVLLLAATVLYYSGQHAVGTGASTEAYFEPEAVTRDALFRLGFPVAVLLFAFRVITVRRARSGQG